MALVTTTLSSALGVNDTSMVVASATSLVAGRIARIDDEYVQVNKGYSSGTTVGILRGQQGSASRAHVTTANVVHGDAGDFTDSPAQASAVTLPYQVVTRRVSITATSSLTLPKAGEDLIVTLNGTAAITLTIPVPTKDLDGCRLVLMGNGAAAHVLTFTGGLSGGGGSYDVVTINATAPTAMQVIASNGLWLSFVGPAMAGTVTNITGTLS